MLDILAHRGWWNAREEQNSLAVFERAFADGFGIETDLRDCDGELVISHDMPRKGAVTLDALVKLWARYEFHPLLALNIKADGLAKEIARQLHGVPADRWFAFDMSVPDTLHYQRLGLPFLSRRSEYEAASPLEGNAAGLWMDCFVNESVRLDDLRSGGEQAALLCVVSPELHGRPHKPGWAELEAFIRDGGKQPRLALCTDFPDVAKRHFANAGS